MQSETTSTRMHSEPESEVLSKQNGKEQHRAQTPVPNTCGLVGHVPARSARGVEQRHPSRSVTVSPGSSQDTDGHS